MDLKKFFISAALAAMFAPGGMYAGTAEKYDTIIVSSGKKVVVENMKNGYKMSVASVDVYDDSVWIYRRTMNPDGTDKVEISRTDGNSAPKIFKAYIKMQERFNPHWSGLEAGFVAPVGTKSGGLNGPEKLSGKVFSSWEFAVNLMEFSLPMGHSGFGCFTGLGLDWRNIRLDNDYVFAKDPETGKTSLVKFDSEAGELKSSRFHTFSITVPLMFEWQDAKTKGDNFWINAGAVVNFTPYATYLTKWREGDIKCEDITYKTKHKPVTVDLRMALGVGNAGLYVKYSPMTVIKSGYGPDMCPLSFGFTIN